MITILIADDHPIVREGLKQVLAKASDMTIGGEALNGQEVLDAVEDKPWDVVILDFSMPGRNVVDVIKTLRRDHPKLPILVLSMYPESELAPRLLKAGASGYLNKESAPRELVNAVRKVYAGGRYVSPALAETLAANLSSPAETNLHELLSDREYQVLLNIAAGRSVQQIADDFALSVKTVRTYRERLFQKLHVKNDVELTHYALERRLLTK